jgi:hypothetical protein
MGSRCGSPTSNPDRFTTSPPRAPTCYPAYQTTKDLPILADLGYEGAGHGVLIPVKQPTGGNVLDIDTRTYNMLLRARCCLGERGFALLTQRWRALQHITASPGKTGDIAKAPLVSATSRESR